MSENTVQYSKFAVSGALALFSILLLVSIPQQNIHGDEAWLGEQAYFLERDGVCRSELFRGFLGYEERILVAHKLFIFLGAMEIRLFGWRLWSLRLLSLMAGAVLLVAIFRHLRGRNRRDIHWRGALLFLISTPLFFKFVNLYRPEILLATCGFGSYYFLIRFLDRRRTRYLLGSALLAGIAVLVHLNGLIYIAAGVVVLLWCRHRRAVLLFLPVSLVIGAFYFWDVWGNWPLFHLQFMGDPALDAADFRWDAPFWRLLDEHKRLFRKPEIIFTSAISLSSMVYIICTDSSSRRRLVVYTIALIIGLGLLGQAKTTPYAIALFPFFAIIVARATGTWLRQSAHTPRFVSLIALALWVSFLLHGLYANTLCAFTGKQNLAADNLRLGSLLVPGETVLAPMSFVFNEIDHFDIRGLEAVRMSLPKDRRELYAIEDYLTWAATNEVRTIILDEHRLMRMSVADADVGQAFGAYDVVARLTDPDYLVLRRSADNWWTP